MSNLSHRMSSQINEYLPSPVVRAEAEGRDYLFVENIRFLSMAVLFVEHAIASSECAVVQHAMPLLYTFTICFTKFGTVAFFFISGFLLGKKIEYGGALKYLKRRLDRIFLPWLVWASIFTFAIFINQSMQHTRPFSGTGISGWLVGFGRQIAYVVVNTEYWFVPQLFVALGTLLIFRKYLASLWLGGAFAAISLFYAANIYLHLIPTSHTTAFFGFTFYLWLGYFLSNRLEALQRWASSISFLFLIPLAIFLGVASFAESRGLQLHFHLSADESMNSLRVTSQLYALAVTLLLFKIPRKTWPGIVNVRSDTFGLYLLQAQVLYVYGGTLHRLLPSSLYPLILKPAGAIVLWLVASVIAYAAALAITKLILSFPALRWTVGAVPPAKAAPLTQALAAS